MWTSKWVLFYVLMPLYFLSFLFQLSLLRNNYHYRYHPHYHNNHIINTTIITTATSTITAIRPTFIILNRHLHLNLVDLPRSYVMLAIFRFLLKTTDCWPQGPLQPRPLFKHTITPIGYFIYSLQSLSFSVIKTVTTATVSTLV